MNTERQKLYVYYRGQLVELVNSATVMGTTYYEIRLPDKSIRAVPAKDCTQTKNTER